jgi:ArsR family transcriptional regulator
MHEPIALLESLADPARLRLLRLLHGRELCVCELVDTLRIPQYAVSRHLRQLRTMGLVEARRDGRWMHYRLGPEMAKSRLARELLSALVRHLDGTAEGRRDERCLKARLAQGRTGRCLMPEIRRARRVTHAHRAACDHPGGERDD